MKLCGVCILTNNVPQLVQFYEKVLQCSHEGDEIHSAFPAAQLAIYNPGNAVVSSDKNMALMFFADDADREYRRLLSLGVTMKEQPSTKPWNVRSFVFYDPDGNEISFVTPIVQDL